MDPVYNILHWSKSWEDPGGGGGGGGGSNSLNLLSKIKGHLNIRRKDQPPRFQLPPELPVYTVDSESMQLTQNAGYIMCSLGAPVLSALGRIVP